MRRYDPTPQRLSHRAFFTLAAMAGLFVAAPIPASAWAFVSLTNPHAYALPGQTVSFDGTFMYSGPNAAKIKGMMMSDLFDVSASRWLHSRLGDYFHTFTSHGGTYKAYGDGDSYVGRFVTFAVPDDAPPGDYYGWLNPGYGPGGYTPGSAFYLQVSEYPAGPYSYLSSPAITTYYAYPQPMIITVMAPLPAKVPEPSAAAAGLCALPGIGGLICWRRRRA